MLKRSIRDNSRSTTARGRAVIHGHRSRRRPRNQPTKSTKRKEKTIASDVTKMCEEHATSHGPVKGSVGGDHARIVKERLPKKEPVVGLFRDRLIGSIKRSYRAMSEIRREHAQETRTLAGFVNCRKRVVPYACDNERVRGIGNRRDAHGRYNSRKLEKIRARPRK